MGQEELQPKARQEWLWMLFFSCAALSHSLITGWLAPLGLFFARQLGMRCSSSAFAVVIGATLSVAAGIAVGLLDALWLRTALSTGTAFVFIVALASLGIAAFPSDPKTRWWYGLHGLFLTAWFATFYLLRQGR